MARFNHPDNIERKDSTLAELARTSGNWEDKEKGLMLKLVGEKKLSCSFDRNYCLFENIDTGDLEMSSANPFFFEAHKINLLFFPALKDIKEYRKWLVYYGNQSVYYDEKQERQSGECYFSRYKKQDFIIVRMKKYR